jgi:hypothetical protein
LHRWLGALGSLSHASCRSGGAPIGAGCFHADCHFARPFHPMSRFSEPSVRRLLRGSRFAVAGPVADTDAVAVTEADAGSRIGVRGPCPGCADVYGGGRVGMGSTANGPSPRRRWT